MVDRTIHADVGIGFTVLNRLFDGKVEQLNDFQCIADDTEQFGIIHGW